MKVKMTSRKVGFRWNEKNVTAFINGFRFECEKQRFVEGINLVSDFCLEPTMILKLRFCKEVYDQQREIGMQTASFSQGVAAAFYMINSRDDNESSAD